jgi:long-subunit fatty acid transport protein
MFPRTASTRIFILLLLLIPMFRLQAQIQVISPYSRFGLGDLAGNSNAWNMSMAQLGIGIQNPIHVNFTNPASYAAFDSLSFVFEGGFTGEFINLTSNFQSVNRSNGSLSYLLFGMPVNRWWKTSLGLVPFSNVGYNVANYEEYPQTGTVKRVYSGSGGISRIYWGNAFKIAKGLSLGLNASYLFGSMDLGGAVYFPDSLNTMNFRVSNALTMNDLSFTFGAQYKKKLTQDVSMIVGAVYTPTLNMAAKTDIIATTFLTGNTGLESVRDTLLMKEGLRGDIVIPTMAGGGVSVERNDKWMAGVDFKWQNWDKFKAFEMSDSLANSWQVSAGAQVIPNIDNYNNYLARIHYRLGFTFNKTYLVLRGQQLNEYAISAGFGLPLRGIKTMVNVALQYGNRGTTAQNLIQESYFRVVIGFSIYERWFVKRKYF